MPPLARRIPALIAIAGLVLLAAFTWIERGPSLALLWPWHLYAQLLALLPALWLLAQLAVTGEFRRFGGLLDIGLLGFAGITIASALVSDRREIATSMLPIALVPVVLTYGLHQWLGADPAGRRKRLAEFGGLFLACATAVALGGWLWFRALPALAAGGSLAAILDGRNDWLLGHTVYTAGLALLCTTWLGGLAFERAGRSRLLCALGAMLGLILLFTSGSRSGFIGLAAWSGWLLWTETRRRRWSMGRTATLTLVVLAAAGAFALLHPRSRLIVREWHNSGTLNMGDRQRLAMAEFGLIALQERPLLGFGPGTTPLVYPAYRARLSGGVETALQLHSTPMQWLADSGTPALLAAVLVAAALWWRRKHETATFSCGTLLAYSALALTDYQLDLPLFAFALGTLLALCAQRQTAPEPRHAAARTVASIGIPLAAALVAYAATQVPPLRARASFALAIESLGQGDVAGFETGMAEAHRLSPRNTYYLNLHACILAAVQAYPTWFLPVDFGPDRKDRADALLRRSLEVDPCQELPHTHLAWHLLDTAPAEAIAHFRAAAQLIPDKGSLYFGQALVQLHLGRIDQASRALALELLNDPAFVTSPEWVRLAAVPGLVSTARHAAADELDRLAAAVPTNDSLGTARRARYTAALLRWIDGDETALAGALGHAEPEQRELIQWIAGQPTATTEEPATPWYHLAQAAARPAEATTILSSHYPQHGPTPESLAAMVQALAQSDRRALLRGEAVVAPITQPRIYRERAGYPLLLRNLDAPAPRDPYIVPLNRLVRDFLAPLFPEKGYLPGPALIQAQADLGLANE